MQFGRSGRSLSRLALPALALSVVGCCAFLWWCDGGPPDGFRVEQLEPDLQQRVPIGASRDDAEAWFASRGLSPSGIVDDRGHDIGLESVVRFGGCGIPAEIQVFVYFDGDGRVKERFVRRVDFWP